MEARPYQTGPSFWLTIQVLHGLCHRMSDRKALARAIAARTTPRFIEIKNEKRDRRPIRDWPRRDALGRERAKAAIASPDRRLAADLKGRRPKLGAETDRMSEPEELAEVTWGWQPTEEK